MERMWRQGGVRAGIAIGAAIAFAGIAFGVTVASIPSGAGTISACYAATNGALRVIDYPSHRCARGERLLRWNQASAAGSVPLLALAGTACSGIGGAGTLNLGVTPGTGVVSFTCKVSLKVQSAIALATIDLTAGPPGQVVTQRCLNATSCSLLVPFGSPIQIALTGSTYFKFTCPGFTDPWLGVPDTTRTQWTGTCSKDVLNSNATVIVTKF